MKTKLLLASLILLSAGALAQEPEQARNREQVVTQAQNREAVQAQERVPEGVPVEEALQNREQKRLERAERKNARKENNLKNRSRGTERSEAARIRSQSMRQEKGRVENRPGARPDSATDPAKNVERGKPESRSNGGK